MPELPEVETVRRGLELLIVGKTIQTVTSDTPKSFPNSEHEVERFVVGATVTAVKRRAKVLLIELSSDYTLVTHLKMTGQLVFVGQERFGAGHPNDSLIHALPDKTTRVEITFRDESKLFFNDQRKFGWMKLYPSATVPNIDFMQRLGPEPLDEAFTPLMLRERLQRRKNTSVKAALLDQTVVAGIGNIYADESLWVAGIHPSIRVRAIPKTKITELTAAIKAVMTLSIEKGGSTDKNYINAEGRKGSYLQFAKVFRREGQSCPRCGTTIEKLRVAGRGTHICPTCQIAKDS